RQHGHRIAVRPFLVADTSRNADPVELVGVTQSDIPEIVLTPRRRESEPGEGRRDVAHQVGTGAITYVSTKRGRDIPPTQAAEGRRRPEASVLPPQEEAPGEVVTSRRTDYAGVGQVDLGDTRGGHVGMADPDAAEPVRVDVPSAMTKI